MSYIVSIRIQNFQSHKRANLILVEGVNVITGQSDCGKSAIVRAIRWVMENKPLGDSYMSTFAKGDTTEVTITFSDGTIVKRRKNKKDNQYIINGGKPLKAIGNKPPPKEALDAMNMTEINIQHQHSPYFLLNQTGGQVAKKFNELADLQITDKALQKANSIIKTAKQDMDKSAETVEGHQVKLKDLAWIKDAEPELVELEVLDKKIDAIIDDLEVLEGYVKDIETLDVEIGTLTEWLGVEKWVSTLEGWASDIDLYKTKINKLSGLVASVDSIDAELGAIKIVPDKDVQTLEDLNEDINKTKVKLTRLQDLVDDLTQVNAGIDAVQEIPDKDVQVLADLSEDIDDVQARLVKLKSLVSDAESLDDGIYDLEQAIKQGMDDLKEEFDGECPTCKQDITDEYVEAMSL